MKCGKWGKRVLMCFLSRSLDAVRLGKARLSMANRFPHSLKELFLKTSVHRGSITVRVHNKEMEHIAIKQLLSYILYHKIRRKHYYSLHGSYLAIQMHRAE